MPWRGPEVPGEYPTNGYVVIDWIQNLLRITDGPKIGEPVKLYDEQQMFFLKRYRIDPDAPADAGADAYVYGGSQLIRGQKWGKDPIMAMDDLVQAFGPCIPDGYDGDGEPVGRPHPSPWVGVAALNDLQANNTWLPLKAMVETSELIDYDGVEVTQDQIRLPCGNPIERLTTTAFGRLGGRFTAVSLTENGLMTATGEGGNTGKRSPLSFARTMLRSVAGMNGLWMAASNSWDPTELSHAQQIVEGKDPHTHVDAKLSRGRVEFDDDAKLDEELRYLYGDSLTERGGHVSLQRLKRDIRNPASGENEVRRFYLSEALAGEEPLSSTERWAALDRGPRNPAYDAKVDALQPGQAITLGFDGSRSRDMTVLDAVRISDGRVFPLKSWTPRCMCAGPSHKPAQCKDRKIPRSEVDQAVDDAFTAYTVWYLFGDPYKYQESLESWAAKYLLRDDRTVPGLKRGTGRVIEVPTNVETRMDDMLTRFTTARDEGAITHDGNDELAEHVRNTVIAKGRRKPSKPRVDTHGKLIEHYLKLAKKREGLLIDHSIGMVLAFAARGQAIEDGALNHQQKPPPPPPELLGSGSGRRGGRGRTGGGSGGFDPATSGF